MSLPQLDFQIRTAFFGGSHCPLFFFLYCFKSKAWFFCFFGAPIAMAPNDTRRPYKRPAISDQQKRRELTLRRQEQSRRDAQLQARRLATTLFSLSSQTAEESSVPDIELVSEPQPENESGSSPADTDFDIRHASRLKGSEARKWFARQLMLPEWMIDVPDRLPHDWLAPYMHSFSFLISLFLFS